MLMQTIRPSARRCSNGWRVGFSVLLVAALALSSGIFGVRRASAQATPEEKAIDKRIADEKAEQRQAEIEQLRAQQEQIKAQLDVLEVEKRKIQRELEQRKSEGAETAQNAAVAYKRMLAQREQALAQAKQAEAAELWARVAAKQEDAALERDRAAKEQQKQAWTKWNEDRIAAGNREQREFPGRAQLDLVSLANSYVDAVGSVSLAEVRMQAMELKQDQAGVRIEKVNLDTAKRKVAIFRSIAEAARDAAKADLEMASQQFKNGIAPKNAVIEAESRLRILEVILAQ